MAKTKIEWTHGHDFEGHTWNPLRGTKGKWFCTKVSEGCANCYAERMNLRFGGTKYTHGADKLRLDKNVLKEPLSWRKKHMTFVCSMSDLFQEGVTMKMLDEVFKVMTHPKCKKHVFQILTKRPKRMLNYIRSRYPTDLPANIWCGTSCEHQKAADERIPLLRQVPAAIRFLSCEPLVGAIDLQQHLTSNVEWVIAGGESGTGMRQMELDWARDVRDHCLKAEVPFFLKQLGGHPDKRGGDDALLDGKLWRDFPEIVKPQLV